MFYIIRAYLGRWREKQGIGNEESFFFLIPKNGSEIRICFQFLAWGMETKMELEAWLTWGGDHSLLTLISYFHVIPSLDMEAKVRI